MNENKSLYGNMMMSNHPNAKRLSKKLIQKILERPHSFDWSMQGLGMLRLYLSPETRLHIWSSAHAEFGVSTAHNHPWHFHSTVIAGELRNRRYHEGQGPGYLPFKYHTIQCGPGGGPIESPKPIYLTPGQLEVYKEGESYGQMCDEIHDSLPLDGTVTVITRVFTENAEHARVFWPADQEWTSAEPGPASYQQVQEITQLALERWFQ